MLSAEEITFIDTIKKSYLTKQFIGNDFCERLPIEEGYIRLALVEEEGQRRKEKENLNNSSIGTETTSDKSSQTFTDKRLSSFEDIYGTKTPIEPKDIFKSQSASKSVRRVLILGRAGIGKSTLCHYVAYQWAKETLWKDDFVLVLWIPLRQLTHYPDDKANLFDMVLNECIPDDEFGDKPYQNANEIKQLFKSLSAKGNILYVCDGFDEVKHLAIEEPGKETSQGKLIRLLLNKPDVMMTSRPYYIDGYLNSTAHNKGIDQRLENIGFLDNDVDIYIQNYFAEPAYIEIGKRLIVFLNRNRSLKGIAHISINLSLICNAWKQHHNNIKEMPTHLTMTDLYVGLMTDLGIRYLMHQCHQSKPEQSMLSDIFKHPLCQPIVAFLAELAFEQMQKSDLIILPKTVHAISKKYPDDKILNKALQFGLLKALDKNAFEGRNSYYFVHLTFQEFLAAYHIAEKLKQKDAMVDDFIQQHKYHPKYEITWWFVAGLLRGHTLSLEHFFDVLEAEPRDLVGLTHQLLIMRCLDECALTLAPNRKQALLATLIHWMQFEMLDGWKHRVTSLITYLALSSRVLNETSIQDFFIALLRDPDRDVRMSTVWALPCWATLSEAAQGQFVALLQDPDSFVKAAAALTLGKQWTGLPEAVQAQFAGLLKDPECFIRSLTADGVLRHPWTVLPEAVQAQLVGLLKDPEASVRAAAAVVLGKQWTGLPEAVQAQLVGLLKDPEASVRAAAAEALGQQWAVLPEAVQNQLVASLQDPEVMVRKVAIRALAQQSTLPKALQTQLAMLLKYPMESVGAAAICILRLPWAVLPEAMRAQVVASLQDLEEKVRKVAAKALEQRSTLPEAVQAQLMASLQDPEWCVRAANVWVLGKQWAALPDAAQTQLAMLLKDPKAKVRALAVEALVQQWTVLPEAVQAQLAGLLKDPEASVRAAVAEALGQLSNLPQNILQQLGNMISSESVYNTITALQKASYRQAINYINFRQPCAVWLPLLKVLLLKSLQQRTPIYFIGNQLYIEKEKINGGNFTDAQKEAFIKATQQIMIALIPNFSEMAQPQNITNTLEENPLVNESKPWCRIM